MNKEFAAGRPSREPTHPGVVLRETVLPALKMSVAEAAGHLGVTRQTLHRILSERTSVTPEMALRLGKFCGNGPGLWLRMQQVYDLWRASEKLRDEVKRIPTVREAA
jgi:antitoxin HigA-1